MNKYVSQPSKIVFADLFLLLTSVLIGINAVMSVSDETHLTPVELPEISNTNHAGTTQLKPVYITIKRHSNDTQYYYNKTRYGLHDIMIKIKQTHARMVLIRADKDYTLVWDELTQFINQLMNAGIKEIGYSIQG